MLECLWRQIDPNFKWGEKPEEQIPSMFQNIKYPFTIIKVFSLM
jgi:SMC interacting uncharacterized protein involved in chromosome segregation